MSPVVRALTSLLVIGLSAAATWVAVGLQPPPPPPPSQVDSVFSFRPEAVVGIAATTRQGSIRAVRREGHWDVQSIELRARASSGASDRPDQARIDLEVGALVEDVAALPEVSRFPRAGPLSEFGLDQPSARIVVTLDRGETVDLQIGSRTTSGAGLYARIGSSDEVLQIGGLILNEVGGTLFQLRALAGS